jgi:hypothetical protein
MHGIEFLGVSLHETRQVQSVRKYRRDSLNLATLKELEEFPVAS